MKTSTNNFRSRVFKYAWATMKSLGCSFREALKSAWLTYKQTNTLTMDKIKQILKEFKDKLQGKTLVVNGVAYKTLKDFGNALLELLNFDYIACVTWRDGRGDLCLSVEHSLRCSLEFDRFDVLRINSGKWEVRKPVNLDYSNVDFEKFGTTA